MHIIIIPDNATDKYLVDRQREKNLTDMFMEIKDVNRVTIVRVFTDTIAMAPSKD